MNVSMSLDLSRRLGDFPYPTTIAPTYLFISHFQYSVLACIPFFVAPLSIFGSLAIIFRIVRFDRHEADARNRRTYHRLIVAMSSCDVVGSLALFFGGLPVPRDTMLSVARGNTATCTAQGFFMHAFVFAVLYYNTGLMIYFVVTVRYNWTESQVSRRLEPLIHCWALFVPIGQAVAGLFLDVFHPFGFGAFCYIAPYPVLCELFDACSLGKSAKVFYSAFNTIPTLIVLFVIYGSILLIYCSVRGRARRALAISAHPENITARTKSVAIQSLLFALAFFFTWIFTGLVPILEYTARPSVHLRSGYILGVLSLTFLPLQGFFNFCIYIRPRLMRLWGEQEMSFWAAVQVAVFGGRETIMTPRRMSVVQQRKRSTQTIMSSTLGDVKAVAQTVECRSSSSSQQPQLDSRLTDDENEVGVSEGNLSEPQENQGDSQVPGVPLDEPLGSLE